MILDHRPGQPDDAKWPREDLYDRDVDGLHMPFPPPITVRDPRSREWRERRRETLKGAVTIGTGVFGFMVLISMIDRVAGFKPAPQYGHTIPLPRTHKPERRPSTHKRPYVPAPDPIPPTLPVRPLPGLPRPYTARPGDVFNLTPRSSLPSGRSRAKSAPRPATRPFPPFPRRRPESP